MMENKSNNKLKQNIVINILTRTSNRPIGFSNCHQSIIEQTYKNVKHFVSYEEESEMVKFDFVNIEKIKVERYLGEVLVNSEGLLYAPYNLYCNTLLSHVESGWIMFLDDDDHLLHDKVIHEIVKEIKKADEDTLFIWQMRYPNGKLLPTKEHFWKQKIECNNIGSPCFIFHSKYKKDAEWDQWKGSDYRVIQKLHGVIPKTKWLERVYIQINNYGDLGNRNDIRYNISNRIVYKKNFFWFLIPKYHTQIKGLFVFQLNSYKKIWKRGFRKIKYLLKIKKDAGHSNSIL